MLRKMNELIQWLTLADYDSANETATQNIIKRFTRENILLKNGLYMTKRTMNELSKAGDRAVLRLQKKVASH